MSAHPDNRTDAMIGRVGDVIAGRYTLLGQVGMDSAVHATFWRARDTVLQRDVGLTLLIEAAEPGEAERSHEMIDRALRWGGFCEPGVARLLDVMRRDNGTLPEDVLAVAITEWVAGHSLAEVAGSGVPVRTTTALSMLDPLARAAAEAHRQGLVLGCSHPQRVRFTPEGVAKVAFALPSPDTLPADDVCGLGAVLYTLITAHWPLSGTDAQLAELPAAPRDVHDVVVPPGILRPGTSLEVSALALGALNAGGGWAAVAAHGRVHTAAAVHRVISDLVAAEQDSAMLPPPDDGAPPGLDEVWRDTGPARHRDEQQRQRKVRIAMTALGAAAVAVVLFLLIQLGALLGVGPASPPPIVLVAPSAPAAASPQDLAPSTAVQPASISVFDPTGDPDNTGRVSRAVDDDPRSSWSTYVYRRPFPSLKPGVGLLVSFASPVQLSQLTVSSPSRGSRIEIRSAPNPDTTIAQTVLITTTVVAGEQTTVPMAGSQPVQHLLLWITDLGGGGDENVTEIADLHFDRALG